MLVSLVEERLGEAGMLTQTGAACLWRILGLRAGLPLNHLCRRAHSFAARSALLHVLLECSMLNITNSHVHGLEACCKAHGWRVVWVLPAALKSEHDGSFLLHRLLAAAGLPYRVIRALDAATAEQRSLPLQVLRPCNIALVSCCISTRC